VITRCNSAPMSDLPLQAWRHIGQSEPPTLGSGRLPQLAGSSLTCYRWRRGGNAPAAGLSTDRTYYRSSISRPRCRGGVGVRGRGGPHGAPRLAVNSLADRSSHSNRIGCVPFFQLFASASRALVGNGAS
jgi:hypothetical protein